MKKIWLVIATLLIILLGCVLYINLKSSSQMLTVPQSLDLITQQNQIDQDLQTEIEIGNYTFENPFIKINPYQNSPLTALVAFTTSQSQAVEVRIEGKDEFTTFKTTLPAATNHLVPIYGLYPDTLNHVTLTLSDGSSTTLDIQTDPLPDDFILPTSVTYDANQATSDLFFYTPASAGYTAAYDLNGDVRWYLTTANVWEINRLKNGNLILSSNRTVNAPYYMAGLMEMDLLGKVYHEYVFPGGYHHDVYELDNGNFIVAGNNPSKTVVEDYVIEINRQSGEVIKEWDLSSVLPTDAGKSENWTEHDWFHNNSVYYDHLTDAIILSGRHQDAVISIDYETGDLNWIIGDSTNWPEEMQRYFFTPIGENFEWQWSQHSAKVLPNGDLFIFDNGNNRSKNPLDYVEAKDNYSRGVIYRLNTDEMTIEQIYEYGKELGSSFYSPYISEVDYLGENHYLIHSGGMGSVNGVPMNQPAYFNPEAKLEAKTVEVLKKQVITTLDFPTQFYRVQKMSLYSSGFNYNLEPGTRLGTLGQTPTLKLDINGLWKAKELPANDYHLTFNQESDRLIFNAQFKEGQKVKLILSKLGDQRVYDIRVSKTSYSAMCIDLFNASDVNDGDLLSVTNYINAEGLSGTYQLYIQIDGNVYKINQKVTF